MIIAGAIHGWQVRVACCLARTKTARDPGTQKWFYYSSMFSQRRAVLDGQAVRLTRLDAVSRL